MDTLGVLTAKESRHRAKTNIYLIGGASGAHEIARLFISRNIDETVREQFNRAFLINSKTLRSECTVYRDILLQMQITSKLCPSAVRFYCAQSFSALKC